MKIDAAAFIVSMIISSIGFVFFMYGKKLRLMPHAVAGLTLMIYPYFVSSILWMILIALGIIALFVLAVRQGL